MIDNGLAFVIFIISAFIVFILLINFLIDLWVEFLYSFNAAKRRKILKCVYWAIFFVCAVTCGWMAYIMWWPL